MSKQHTPTPYRLVKAEGYGKSTLIMSGTDIIAELIKFEKKIPTGEFIVKACNNHDRLVEALERTNEALRLITILAQEDEDYQGDHFNAMTDYEKTQQLLTELKEETK